VNKKRWSGLLSGVGAILFLGGVWFLSAHLLNKPLLPNPLTVIARLPYLVEKRLLWHLKASLFRIFFGLFVASSFGFLSGLLIGRCTKGRAFFDALIYLTYPIPKMALLPVVMLLGGLGDTAKVVMIVLIVYPQVTVAVRDAIRQIHSDYYKVYQTLQASSLRQLIQITIPAAIPSVLSAIRISLGTALSILFFTENYGTEYGMGYLIMDSWTRMDYPAMYGGILILSGLGFGLFLVLDWLSWWSCSWQE
jgi:ABC-type nitrate/sulfonate/bicarbonate transport system permease component